jgi:hypothetical protein
VSCLCGGLLEVGNQVIPVLLLLQATEGHLGAGNVLLGVLEVGEEGLLVPGDALLLVGVGVGVALDGTGLAAEETVQSRADLVAAVLLDGVALRAAGLEEAGTLLSISACDSRVSMCLQGGSQEEGRANEMFHEEALGDKRRDQESSRDARAGLCDSYNAERKWRSRESIWRLQLFVNLLGAQTCRFSMIFIPRGPQVILVSSKHRLPPTQWHPQHRLDLALVSDLPLPILKVLSCGGKRY